jgi:HSP20 family molecular chaperone IbpA
VPGETEEASVQAGFKDGILTLTLTLPQKKIPAAKQIKIEDK